MPPSLTALARRTALVALLGATVCLGQSAPSLPKLGPPAPAAAPVNITLEDAIRRADANEPIFAAARADRGVAAADRNIARAALLPNVLYHNQAVYTQPTNVHAPKPDQIPIFIANNGVHEYVSQGQI